MKLYLIEYYDIDFDQNDYTTATGNNENEAANKFISATQGRKILVDIIRVSGVDDRTARKLGYNKI